MDRTHHIYLIPGFLGFPNLGRITYFGHVGRVLTEGLTALGLEPHIRVVRTSPTASPRAGHRHRPVCSRSLASDWSS